MSLSGNDNRLFQFIDDTPANAFTPPAPVAPDYTSMVDQDGNVVNFLGMSTPRTPCWL